MILTAGPSITNKEIAYVLDAVMNGWNSNWNGYINKFQDAFAEYLGMKYALVTSGGTGALWLGLVAHNIGKGDEVILPEITYYACSDVIKLVGATPVFVDILPDTWCIDPKEVKKKITKRTKAIMPVDIYGNASEMLDLKEFGLPLIEDACPAAGAYYHGHPVGHYADVTCFSFQGAKIMVTGVGGMFLTNSKKLYERAEFINDHGESNTRKFWQEEVGYEFEMSNIQAALGLAQLERLDELVNKKRMIFEWYEDRLGGLFQMNKEKPWAKSNMWMSSIILPDSVDREWFMAELKKRNIDNRPFFYPISMFPMYEEQKTPVAHRIGLQGVNLPSGYDRTLEEVDYICNQIIELYATYENKNIK